MRLEKLITEIEVALEKECYLSALALALIIPDICAKVTYPEIYNTKGKDKGIGAAYAKWYDEYIGQYDISPLTGIGLLDGLSCWKLRCGFLHNWTIDLDEELSTDLNNVTFKIIVPGRSKISGSSVTYSSGLNGNKGFRHIELDLKTFCKKICAVFQHSYLENSEIREKLYDDASFNFFEVNY